MGLRTPWGSMEVPESPGGPIVCVKGILMKPQCVYMIVERTYYDDGGFFPFNIAIVGFSESEVKLEMSHALEPNWIRIAQTEIPLLRWRTCVSTRMERCRTIQQRVRNERRCRHTQTLLGEYPIKPLKMKRLGNNTVIEDQKTTHYTNKVDTYLPTIHVRWKGAQ